ncbi:hypothetical protein EX30DRAFT_344262 [Ascodesmis nigricans]|uniref:Uncharacterized protein n=1 Tax=Ascodesmis nigricans TaxID=341454 RepID=A0A4S2MR44_9PEZI|nr:hypothetical protein EX30DRAFT_344262 [Ascodesmis nigricans]
MISTITTYRISCISLALGHLHAHEITHQLHVLFSEFFTILKSGYFWHGDEKLREMNPPKLISCSPFPYKPAHSDSRAHGMTSPTGSA